MTWPDLSLFDHRHHTLELMDLPETPESEFTRALYDIQWVNEHLSGTNTLLKGVRSLLDKQTPGETIVRILDLGTGSADIPLALAQWGTAHGWRFDITAVDDHPTAVAVASVHVQTYPNIHVQQANALQIAEPDETFDIVMASMFMHHLSDEDAVQLMQEMSRLSRLGFVINDLARSPAAYWSIKLLGQLLGKGRVFKNDAPLSVLRGFTLAELEKLKQQANLPYLRIKSQWPYRVLLVEQKP